MYGTNSGYGKRQNDRMLPVENDRRRGSNTLDPDWVEQATVRQNDEVLDELAEEERLQASAIRAALQRLEDGTYGRCESCGAAIKRRRLRAIPEARICLQCELPTDAVRQGKLHSRLSGAAFAKQLAGASAV